MVLGATRTGASDGTVMHEHGDPTILTGVANVKDAIHVERSVVVLTHDGVLLEVSTSRESMPADAAFWRLATDVVSMEAGERHIIFRKTDSTLWGWGVNKSGELGAASYELWKNTPIPMQPPVEVSLNGRAVPMTNGVIIRAGLLCESRHHPADGARGVGDRD